MKLSKRTNMAKILISSIGTGNRENYNTANYEIDSKIYENEKFIASVLCKHIGIDKLFLVGTKDSIWELVYEKFGGGDEMEIYEARVKGEIGDFLSRIEDTIDKKLGTKGSKCFIIEYGLNDDELWTNFDKFLQIAQNFAKNDEIYIDITHSFRSLSLMSFVMSEFISNSSDQELDIRGVYYGMFEYAKSNEGKTPIINLSIFFELLKWSKAIREFKKYGNAKELLVLLDNLKDENKDIYNKFKSFSDSLSMSDLAYIQRSIPNLKTKISFFKDNHNNLYKLISKDLEKFIDTFDVQSLSLLRYKLAKWYCENQNYSLGYMYLAEAFFSAVAEDNGLDPNNKEDTENIKKIIKDKKGPKEKENEYNIYYKIRDIRNYIAHALDLDNRYTKINPNQSIENLLNYIKKVEIIFKDKK